MKVTKLIFKLFLLSIVLIACDENDAEEFQDVLDRYENGMIISAEGNFQAKDGSLSFVTSDYSVASNFVYKGVNGAQLGGLIQSVAFNGDDAYVILNDVNTIVVIDRYTFEKKSVITTGLNNPRYMAFSNGKGYVTNWGDAGDTTDDYLAIIDLEANKVGSTTVSLDNGVERIIADDNKLYVSHLGAWSSNNIISVVDATTDTKTSEITVKDNPDEIFFSSTGELIVLSEGNTLYDENWSVTGTTTSAIQFVDVTTETVSKEIIFDENKGASQLAVEGGDLYYYVSADSKVYKISETATELATTGVSVGPVYGMSVKDGLLYTVQKTFTTLSELEVIEYASEDVLYSTAVGLGASKIYFNE